MLDEVGEFVDAEFMIPIDGFVIDGKGAAVGVAPVDILTVNVEGWSAGDVNVFADFHVSGDLLRNVGGSHVGVEFVNVALVVGNFEEIFIKESGAFGDGSVGPFVLFFKKLVSIGLPVALETGGFGGGSSSGAVLVVAE